MAKNTVRKLVKERIEGLSEAAAKRRLVEVAMSYIEGGAQQSSEAIAEFVGSDIKKLFKDIDQLVEKREDEVHREMDADEDGAGGEL